MTSRSPTVKLNPELLVWARSSAGYSPRLLAEELGIDLAELLAWESGDSRPTFAQLEDLAKKVKRPLAAMFLPKPPKEPPPPKDFRLLRGRTAGHFEPATLLAFRQARNLQEVSVELSDALGKPMKLNLPHITVGDDPEEKATAVRRLIDVSVVEQTRCKTVGVALHMWRDALFDLGVLVFQFAMPREDARGFCIMGRDVATIGLSKEDTENARIFSLFHDLCHLCLREPGVSGGASVAPNLPDTRKVRIERFCDRFAGALLLPFSNEDVRTKLEAAAQRLPEDQSGVFQAASRFKVSRYVVLRRMLGAGYIDEDLHWGIFNSWRAQDEGIPRKRKTHGGPGPVTKTVSERGKRLVSLVLDAYDNGRISTRDAGNYLALAPRWFEQARESTFTGGRP